MKRFAFFVLIAAMFAMVAFTMVSNPIPLLNFSQAKAHSGKFQIVGKPVKDKFEYNDKEQLFSFYLIDDNNTEFNVKYKGIKPGNYDQANEITVIGYLNNGSVDAEKLLVKCPSKYEADGKEDFQVMEY